MTDEEGRNYWRFKLRRDWLKARSDLCEGFAAYWRGRADEANRLRAEHEVYVTEWITSKHDDGSRLG